MLPFTSFHAKKRNGKMNILVGDLIERVILAEKE